MKAALAYFVVLASTAAAAEDLVFEGGGTRLALPTSDAQAVFMHGNPSVQFALGDEAAQAFADLTGGMIGESLTVSLCGIDLVQAVVRERLSGRGIVNLPDIEGALAVAEVMRGDAGCDALSPHFPD